MPADRRAAPAALAALTVDLACVAVFAAAGRRSHDEGVSLAGVTDTAWPFLTGAALGWLLSRGWRHPAAVVPTGITVWVCTVAVGMLMRRATSAGTAPGFILVAALVTGVLLIGWRAAVTAVRRG